MCVRPIYLPQLQIYVQCGSCPACTQRRTREWADRLLLERHMSMDKHAVMTTLTYSNGNLPENYSLSKDDLQRFFKRFRKYLAKYYPNIKLRYYVSGEYGPTTSRPHYHAIIFGLDPHAVYRFPVPPKAVGEPVKYFKPLTVNELIGRIWQKGNTKTDPFTEKRANYVAGYIQKKLYNKAGKAVYEAQGRIPPFSLMSRNIGSAYVDAFAENLKKNLTYSIGGVTRIIPRYFRKRLGITPEVMFEKIRPYIDADFELARQQGIDLTPEWQTFEVPDALEASPLTKKRMLLRIRDIDLSQGHIHGDTMVSTDFLVFMQEIREKKLFEIKRKQKEWRNNLDQKMLALEKFNLVPNAPNSVPYQSIQYMIE